MQLRKNDRNMLLIVGATPEVATLKQARSEAEKKAATECTEREKFEAQVGEVQQELQDLMKNTRVWILTRRRERPSSRRPLKLASLPRLKPRRPSRNWMR